MNIYRNIFFSLVTKIFKTFTYTFKFYLSKRNGINDFFKPRKITKTLLVQILLVLIIYFYFIKKNSTWKFIYCSLTNENSSMQIFDLKKIFRVLVFTLFYLL